MTNAISRLLNRDARVEGGTPTVSSGARIVLTGFASHGEALATLNAARSSLAVLDPLPSDPVKAAEETVVRWANVVEDTRAAFQRARHDLDAVRLAAAADAPHPLAGQKVTRSARKNAYSASTDLVKQTGVVTLYDQSRTLRGHRPARGQWFVLSPSGQTGYALTDDWKPEPLTGAALGEQNGRLMAEHACYSVAKSNPHRKGTKAHAAYIVAFKARRVELRRAGHELEAE